MNAQTPKNEPSGGDGLLFSIAGSIIAVVTLEAVFIAYSSWWLLVLVLLSAILATCGVIVVLLRTIDGDTRIAPPSATARATSPAVQRPAPQPIVANARRVAGTH
jgi:hypothetical protein